MRFCIISTILTFLLVLLLASCCVASASKIQSNYQKIDQNITLYTEYSTNLLGKRFVTTADATTMPKSTDPILALVIFVALSSLMF